MSYERVQIGEAVTLYRGEALEVLADLERGTVDAVVTDPPYSSGGAFRGDRNQGAVAKYVNNDAVRTCRTEFTGDNRDGRAFLAWCTMWMGRCLELARPGAVICCFSDWRQVPTVTDAIQCGGWVWRGLATWHKPGVRMQRGRFSASAEYVVYGSSGVLTPGAASPQNVMAWAPVGGGKKRHVAQKPVEVMAWAMGVAVAGGLVLDPFLGSGTSALAALATGRRLIGIEKDEACFADAVRRIEGAVTQGQLL